MQQKRADTKQSALFQIVLLVPARSDVAPIKRGIVHILDTRGAVGQCELAIGDLVAARALLHIIPRAQCILVFDLRGLFAGEGDGPCGGIGTGQLNAAGIPLGQSAIETVKEAGNVHVATGAVGGGWDGHSKDQSYSAEFSRG